MSNQQVNAHGRELVEIELLKRGATSVKMCGTRLKYISIVSKKNKDINLRIKVKRKGSWQTTIDEADGSVISHTGDIKFDFWIFVEMGDEPNFWVVPDNWIRHDIFIEHKKYLEKHNGHRPKNDDSNHHSIEEYRINNWEDRWDLLE
jgi:hypothetical protein